MTYTPIDWIHSDIDQVEIPCPQCGKSFEFDAWTLVNAKENPDAVPRIIDGSICEFVCPNCGYSAHLAHPCLYIDPDRATCIYSVIDDSMKRKAIEMFADPDNEAAAISTCRIVEDRLDLAEKVLILSHGLDDRPIELLKFGIRGSLKLQGLADIDDDVVVRLEDYDGEDTLSFSVNCNEEHFSVDMELAAMEIFSEALNDSTVADDQPFFVDQSWGERTLDILEMD